MRAPAVPAAAGAGRDSLKEWIWAGDPERIDPDDFAPGEPYPKHLVWAECGACGVAVVQLQSQTLLSGLACPRCGAALLGPPPDAEMRLRELLRAEDRLAERLYRAPE